MTVLLLALLLVAPCQAIEGPDTAIAHKMIDLKLTGEWEDIEWTVTPEPCDIRFQKETQSLTFVGEEGQYKFLADAINFTAHKRAKPTKTVTLTKGGVTPIPVPDPIPTPVGTLSWCIAVIETAEQTPAQAAVLNSAAVRALVKLQVVDVTQAEKTKEYLAWVNKAAGKKPFVFFTTDDGVVLHSGALPATVDAMVELLKKFSPPAAKPSSPSPRGRRLFPEAGPSCPLGGCPRVTNT